MTWTNLLANKEAQKHKTSKKELDNMRALIARDLADAVLLAFQQIGDSRPLTTLRSRLRTWRSRVLGIEL